MINLLFSCSVTSTTFHRPQIEFFYSAPTSSDHDDLGSSHEILDALSRFFSQRNNRQSRGFPRHPPTVTRLRACPFSATSLLRRATHISALRDPQFLATGSQLFDANAVCSRSLMELGHSFVRSGLSQGGCPADLCFLCCCHQLGL